ncbi:unnamed protein product [Parnassius apollo]|uniref:(apollo) hypothetical protein n=1 Tax=Parnassius apollo TaxID=110799 RepID=A0A8S3W031_PARAO|nr:unnamed protein product [Parnassius apollo]
MRREIGELKSSCEFNSENIINCEFRKTDLESKIPNMKQISNMNKTTHFGKDKSIIVNFINRYIKEEFVAAARSKKFMTAKDIGFVGNEQRLYVNDHLTPF